MATDFSSLDKLVEFGLGLGVATQMMNTMNHTLAQTAYAGTGINPGLTATPEPNKCEPTPQAGFYIVKDEHVAGPFTESELADLIARSVVTQDTFCWYAGLESWKLANEIPEVNKLLLLNS